MVSYKKMIDLYPVQNFNSQKSKDVTTNPKLEKIKGMKGKFFK
jgi:hypothetical protein